MATTAKSAGKAQAGTGTATVAGGKKTVRVTLVKGLAGTKFDHRATVVGLGLGRLNSSRVLEDTPAVRGMINKVRYLLQVG
jgi:large subunit ribosomal protein L30